MVYWNAHYKDAMHDVDIKILNTEEDSCTNPLQFELDGTTHKLTADDLFAKLVKRHGTDLAISYLNEYVVLQNSFVYNYLTGEVKNKEKYDDYFENAVTTVKDAFEAGDYEVAGYPNNYGWENFLRDHLGVTKEIEVDRMEKCDD